MSSGNGKPIFFGPFEVTDQVFYTTPLSFALVNIKPLLPGHVLVSPHRSVPRLTDLTPPEISDLFLTVQRVQRMIALTHFPAPGAPSAGGFNIAIQDGEEAGQSVPH
ncbi:Dinucleoside triphosphate hydrolase [Pseudogymnoascus australis]